MWRVWSVRGVTVERTADECGTARIARRPIYIYADRDRPRPTATPPRVQKQFECGELKWADNRSKHKSNNRK